MDRMQRRQLNQKTNFGQCLHHLYSFSIVTVRYWKQEKPRKDTNTLKRQLWASTPGIYFSNSVIVRRTTRTKLIGKTRRSHKTRTRLIQ